MWLINPRIMENDFQLIAFYSDTQTLDELIDAGIDGIVIDWENKGKSNRQNHYNTQISIHDSTDLEAVAKKNISKIICRINGPEYWSKDEINNAIGLGATELLVPMIKSEEEVDYVLNIVSSRVKVGVMLETNKALAIAKQLNEMDVHRFFVGLNDLAIERASRNLFLPLVDGTIDELRPKISKRFGIAGLTHPNSGEPIPCNYLIKQMKHYQASFGFLRRTFYKDLSRYTVSEIINSLRVEFEKNSNLKSKNLTLEEKLYFSQDLI